MNISEKAERIAHAAKKEVDGFQALQIATDFIKDKSNSAHDRYHVYQQIPNKLHYPNFPDGQLKDWLLNTYPDFRGILFHNDDILSLIKDDCPFTQWEVKELLLLWELENCYIESDSLSKPCRIW